MPEVTLRGIMFGFATAILAARVAAPVLAESDALPLDEFHAEYQEPWLVPGKVFGTNRVFVIDSGATFSAFDASFKDRLEKTDKMKIRTPDGTAVLSTYRHPPSLSIGKIILPGDDKSFVIDMSAFRLALGRKIDGIVGLSALRKHVLRCNVDRQRLEFWSDIPADSGAEIPVTWRDRLGMEVGLICSDAHRENFLVDSGSVSELRLRADLFDFLQSTGSITSVREIETVTATGISRRSQGIMDRISLGDWQHTDVIVDKGKASSAIGLKYLNRYTVTIDFPGRRLFLKPGRYFAEKSRRTCLGVGIYWRDEQVRLKYVLPGSPAAEAGLKADDIIESVNDKPVDGSSLFKLRRLFENDGETVSLTLRRGDRVASVKIKLADF